MLSLEAHELEFVERLNGVVDIVPELLTAEVAMQAIIRDHPDLKLMAMNVKKHLGVSRRFVTRARRAVNEVAGG